MVDATVSTAAAPPALDPQDTTAASSPTEALPSSSIDSQEATPRGKNRFSLNKFRIPLLSSPRKANSAASTAVQESAAPETPNLSPPSSTADKESLETNFQKTEIEQKTTSEQAAQLLAPPNELRPKRSSLASNDESSSRKASRNMSPHRVSFSPSTEEVAEAREHAQSFAALGDETHSPETSPDGEQYPCRPTKLKAKPASPNGGVSSHDQHQISHLPHADSALNQHTPLPQAPVFPPLSASRIEQHFLALRLPNVGSSDGTEKASIMLKPTANETRARSQRSKSPRPKQSPQDTRRRSSKSSMQEWGFILFLLVSALHMTRKTPSHQSRTSREARRRRRICFEPSPSPWSTISTSRSQIGSTGR